MERLVAHEVTSELGKELDDAGVFGGHFHEPDPILHGLLCLTLIVQRRRAEGESKISGPLTMSIRVGTKMFYTLARERLR